MNDQPESSAAAPTAPRTAGGLLRQARQAQGLHIAALAASIKVVPRKLELLESDQFDQLPDATFTRALAQTVCRTLKIDAAPILALLPPPRGHRLEQVAEGLNMPFHERPGRLVPSDWASVANPVLWIAGVIGVLTVAVYAVPAGWLRFASSTTLPTRQAESATAAPSAAKLPAALPAASGVVKPAMPPLAAASEPLDVVTPNAAAADTVTPDAVTAAAASGVLQFRVSAPSWIEVIDARGQSLMARVLQPGEDAGVDGVMPMKVRIGNAGKTKVLFKGQPLELAAYTRENVARLELK